MLCFGHDWGSDPLSKTHVMRILARDNRILWINSIGYRTPTASGRDVRRALRKAKAFLEPVREVEKNIFVLSPAAVPANSISAVRGLNRILLRRRIRAAMRSLRFERPINWIFNPTGSLVAGFLDEDLIVYYCVDDFTSFSDAGTVSMQQMEQTLFQRADLVVVSSDRLLKSKARFNPRTVLVRHGVDFEHFRKTLAPETVVAKEIADLPRPVIGYFGLMSADWVDVELMVKVAEHFSASSLVLLGKVAMDMTGLDRLANVHFLGRKPFEDLPAYAKGFDVAILPFPVNAVTLSANPLKVREYLAAGLPVVSTRIPEVEVLGEAYIVDTHQEFIHAIETALKDPGPNAARSESMRGQSWEARVQELRSHFETLAR
jgi:glycosyltransferase involved in cell wall biosynthesis